MAKHNSFTHSGSSGSTNLKPLSITYSKPMAKFKSMTIPDSFVSKVLVKKVKKSKKKQKN